MSHVPAVAGRNTKNAVEQMIRIFLIGPDILKKESEDIADSKNRTVVKFKSLSNLMVRHIDNPDVFIIDKYQSTDPSFSKFLSKFSNVPKIIFSGSYSFRGFPSWIRYPLTYPVCCPGDRELDYTIKRALQDKKLLTDNIRLKDRINTLSREMKFFDEVSRILTSSLELEDLFDKIMKKAKSVIKAETWSVFLLDEERGELVSESVSGKKGDKNKIKKSRLKIGEGIAGWVAQEGIPVVVPDAGADGGFLPRFGRGTASKAKSLMCVPIKRRGAMLGVLEIVNKTTKDPFTKDDLDVMMRLVDHAAIAIERVSLHQKMAELSITDDLTKLFNTRYLNRTLEIEITRANRHKSSLSLIFMDIDHFKTINDSYGHLIGSKLLVEMGQLLIKSLRAIDIVARYGGDEFVIVLPQTTPQSALQIAERIRRSVERNIFLKKNGYSLRLTSSFGVASYPESARSKEDLLRLADEAMYRVKYQTRNGVYAIV